MNRLQKAAVLSKLVDDLRRHDSWGGETHIQKAAYLLQEMLGVPLGFEFTLYKHGPFAFDLRDELTSLRADGILKLDIQSPPYGPRFASTDLGQEFQRRYPKTLGEYQKPIEFVARVLGDRRVTDLERLATALYATLQLGEPASVQKRAEFLHQLKPHISLEDSGAAVKELDAIRQQAASL
jgi:hypothetical protein